MATFYQKLLSFFNRVEKLKLLAILSGTVLMGFIEMISIAAIMPFIAIAVNPSIITTSRHLSNLYQYFAFSSPNRFLLFVGGIVFCLLVFGNAFSAFMSFVLIRFSYHKGRNLSCDLLKKYLSQPYPFFLNRNSSELSKNILAEIDRLVTGIITNALQSFSKLIMILSIVTLLVIVEPMLAISVMTVLGGAYFVIYRLIRKKLVNAGKVSSLVTRKRYQTINEVFGAIKELKVMGRERNFLNAYTGHASEFAHAETLSQLSPMVAKYTIEAVAFGGMLLIALYLIATHEGISKFMPLLALYALAGYRLMPAMQQLFASYTLFRYHQAALDILFVENQISAYEFNKPEPLVFQKQLQLKNIAYSYPNAQAPALKNINLQIPIHRTIGFVGMSGAGKTTLIDILLGLLQPTGEIIVDGTPITSANVRAWQQHIGYVPQNIFLSDASIASNIALGVPEGSIQLEAVIQAAKLANLHEFITTQLPQGYDTFVGEKGVRLSGGQRQRIGIARALYHDPELLIFDEATSALDGVTEKVIIEAINKLAKRKTILLIAHRLNTVKDCDEIYVLNQGEIVGQGRYQDLLLNNQSFQHLAHA